MTDEYETRVPCPVCGCRYRTAYTLLPDVTLNIGAVTAIVKCRGCDSVRHRVTESSAARAIEQAERMDA